MYVWMDPTDNDRRTDQDIAYGSGREDSENSTNPRKLDRGLFT